MKKWLIPLASLTLALAVSGTVAAFTLTGGTDVAAQDPAGQADDVPLTSAACEENTPPEDCNDTPVIGDGPTGTGDYKSSPEEFDGLNSTGTTLHGDPTYEQWLAEFGSRQDPVTSIDDIDPNECNQVHNIDACEGEELPVVDPLPEPDGTVSHPTPDLEPGDEANYSSHQGVAVTPDGKVAVVNMGDLEPAGDEEGRIVVHPMPPVDGEHSGDKAEPVVAPPLPVSPPQAEG